MSTLDNSYQHPFTRHVPQMKLEPPSKLPSFSSRHSSNVDVSSAVPRIAFMHIPKTAGMALSRAFVESIAPTKVLFGFDRVLFGTFERFDTIQPIVRRSIYLEPEGLPTDAEFVSGHFSFSTLAQIYPSARYVTFLREPFSRSLSHWLYWRTQSDAQLDLWGDWAQRVRTSRRSFLQFLSTKDIACQTDNIYTRMLLWPDRLIPDGDFIAQADDEILLDQAAERLEQFAYVDVIENPEFKSNIQEWLGHQLTHRWMNETMPIPAELRTPLHSELKPDLFKLLELRTRLDLKLWTRVVLQRMSRWTPESLRLRVLMLNTARYAAL